MKKALLAALVALAVVPATANASTFAVTETTDAPLEAGATTCKSTNPDEGCTLRAAVELADSEGGEATIELPAGSYQETASPEYLDVEDANVTIRGAGATKTFIEGQGNVDVLEVEEDATLTVEGVTVKGGSEDEGGGAWVSPFGTLVVRHSTFTENTATEVGGAIFGSNDSSVVIEESSIVGNKARFFGGGVFLEANGYCDPTDGAKAAHRGAQRAARFALAAPLDEGLTIVRSTVEGNAAVEGDGGGIAAVPHYCEEIAQARHTTAKHATQSLGEDEASILIEQSAIAHNEAAAEDDSEFGGLGGGLYLETYEVEDPIVDTTIADNYATNEGGGVFVEDGEETLVSDTVAYNTIEPYVQLQAKTHPSGVVENDEGVRGANLATYTLDDAFGYIALRNTIVAEETGSEEDNCSGAIESLIPQSGYNLDYPSTETEEATDTCGMSEEEKDLVGTDPKLDPEGLQENGGPTETIALTSESPAIGFVPIAGDCEEEGSGPAIELEEGKSKPVDQRSEPRPGIAGKGCDIGAYEYEAAPPAKEKEVTKPAPVVTPTPTPKSEVLSVKVTSPAECTSKRDFTIHIQNVKQFGVISAVVSIDGKARRTLRGKSLKTGVDLVGLPKGTFTISIVAHTRNGHTLHGQRVYHTCHTKLPGHIYLRL